MKEILVGNSSFENIIKNDYLYVDKTKYISQIIRKKGAYYFLSRPRRFGKSMALSTLEAIFKGKRELFKGLYIDNNTDYDWKEYPVIRIDFSKCARDSSQGVRAWINKQVMDIASSYDIELREKDDYDTNLDSLINGLAEKEQVVVLIDEYDSILTNNINNNNLEDIRLVIRGFYSVLKGQSENIRMCFITGVTKFSKVSIFSAMNNLIDISVLDEYSAAFGYTQNELETYFAEYIEASSKKNGVKREEYLSNLKYWYDGYHFSAEGEAVYNPVSIGSFFYDGGSLFKNYWIQTGMAMLLVEIAKRVKFDVSLTEDVRISEEKLNTPDIVQMVQTEVSRDNFLALLYQTGYLTIKEATPVRGSYLITLGYPNEEVEKGLNEILLPAYVGTAARSFDSLVLSDYFDRGETVKAVETLYSIFASIPYNELVFDAESAVHAGFVCMMNMLEADIIAETATNKGRIDCILKCPNDIYVIEFKFNKSADDAIAQIKEKKYYEPYLRYGKTIRLLGINFSTDERNISEWKEEILK